jgi:hypothetical protein
MGTMSHRIRTASGQEDWVRGKSERIFTNLQALADRHYDEVQRAVADSRAGNVSQEGSQ